MMLPSPEERVPPNHPLRTSCVMVEMVLSTTTSEGRLYKKAQGQEPKLADKNYDTHAFVRELRPLQVTPPVVRHTTRRSGAIAGHTTRHPSSAVSQRKRKYVAESFGWIKTVGLWRKTRHRGVARVGWMFTFAAAVYNPVQMRTLTAVA
jgi:hypothetical protein